MIHDLCHRATKLLSFLSNFWLTPFVRNFYVADWQVFAAMMAFGFGTFGAATVGNVFVNYASTDALAILCRIAIVFSIIFTYAISIGH